MRSGKESLINQQSKQRLKSEITKRINTTMIGAISSIEKYFGKLFGYNEENLTPEQKQNEKIFEAMRSEILDKGNAQIRAFESDLANYDVTSNKFTVTLLPINRR